MSPELNFTSDNASGVCAPIMDAIVAANTGAATAYGNDAATARAEQVLRDLFEHDLAAFPVATGTAANALALAVLAPTWGVIYCHRHAHIEEDECGAPEFFTGGAKLHLLEGDHAKFTADDLEAVLSAAPKGVEHHSQPGAVSLTQATEAGCLYSVEEVQAIAEVAHAHGLPLHMDGARFANAAAALGCSAAELSWRAGVDALSFGATKNGAMAVEAVVFFDPKAAGDFRYRRKRAGHLFSKMRFLSVQLEAYVAGDLWLENARHANEQAAALSAGLAALPGASLIFPTEANEIFIRLPEPVIRGIEADGAGFHRWGDGIRLVTSFDTRAEDVENLVALARRHAEATAGRRRSA